MIHICLIQFITHANHFFILKRVIVCLSLAHAITLSTLCLAQDTTTEPQDPSNATPASSNNPPIMRQTLSNIQVNRQALLESKYPVETVKRIGSEGNTFIGLYEKDKTGNPYGAILIVHGEGQNADWPHTIGRIRQELPEHGWTSLSITLPEPAKPLVPSRPTPEPVTSESVTPENSTSEQEMSTDSASQEPIANNDENTKTTQEPETETETEAEAETEMAYKPQEKLEIKSAEEIEALALERLKEAISFLNSEGQFNIVVAAHGTAALRTMYYIDDASTVSKGTKNNKPKVQRPVRAMVFLNARNTLLGLETSLTKLLDMQDFPILDIYFDEHYLDNIEAQARKKIAKSHNMSAYFLVKLLEPTQSIFDDENRFTRRVRGFLDQHARGVEVESNR